MRSAPSAKHFQTEMLKNWQVIKCAYEVNTNKVKVQIVNPKMSTRRGSQSRFQQRLIKSFSPSRELYFYAVAVVWFTWFFLRFSGSKFLINLRRQFRARKIFSCT